MSTPAFTKCQLMVHCPCPLRRLAAAASAPMPGVLPMQLLVLQVLQLGDGEVGDDYGSNLLTLGEILVRGNLELSSRARQELLQLAETNACLRSGVRAVRGLTSRLKRDKSCSTLRMDIASITAKFAHREISQEKLPERQERPRHGDQNWAVVRDKPESDILITTTRSTITPERVLVDIYGLSQMTSLEKLLGGRTPNEALVDAVRSGHTLDVEVLLDAGANVALVTPNENKTPLHICAEEGHAEVCRLLLDRGANIADRDATNSTPMHLAAAHGYLKVAELLGERGADLRARDAQWRTPLHNAAIRGFFPVVEYLVLAGAEMGAKDDEGITPREWAVTNGHTDVANWLVDMGGW